MRSIGNAERRQIFAMCFIIPAVAFIIFYAYIPIVTTIRYSLTSWNGYSVQLESIGLANYVRAAQDPVIWRALVNNLWILGVSLFLQLPLAFLAAYGVFLLKHKLAETCKILFFVPGVLSPVMIGLIWCFIYDYQRGLVNAALKALGLGGAIQAWLGDPRFVNFAIYVVIIWAYFGLHCILHSSGLNSLPEEIIEAVKIDGAGRFAAAYHVYIPMLSEVLRVSLIMAIIGSFTYFDLIFIMTGGGPFHSSDVLATYMYNRAFQARQFGYGSAIAVIILLLSLAGSILQMRWQNQNPGGQEA